ncbi:MAG: glycosyltransferase family 4 protein [Planctomycetes bacterium]|nr:glycosyltransferase family 4 protein [Planctomycetota bacterium]
MAGNIGFISTRFAGTDGVSLESAKWAQVFWDDKYFSCWYAGRLDRAAEVSHCIPEAYFEHPENQWINQRIWGHNNRTRLVTRRIYDLSEYLKETLYNFVNTFEIRLLVFENTLSIPMHVPLGVAITEFLEETRMPSIAHHHDFYWERNRFLVNCVSDYLEMAFPPRTRNLQHVTINQAAQEELSWRKGVTSALIPNVFDFDKPPPTIDAYSADVRAELGLKPDDIMILQPTRVVPRKGIEHAIKLVQMLDNPKCKLVVSHEAGDEGFEYFNVLQEIAQDAGVDIRFFATRISDIRHFDSEGRKIYTLWDLYPHADLVTYPSLYEGFGNAFLEAVYFRVPVLINRYNIFARDIEPLGFQVPVMDGFVTRRIVEEVSRILEDKDYREAMLNHNYEVAKSFFSYSVLRRKLNALVGNVPGM